jgi:Fe-S oxidoreductase
VPRNVAVLLKQAGVSFGILYEDDLYSGALAYDLGLDEVFARHAARVAALFKRYGIRRVITVDPHTTHVLRTIYPKVVPDFDVTVQHYLEVLEERAPAPFRRMAGAVAIHDSCVLARHEGVTEAPRALLRRVGLQVREPEHHGRQTWCCGGPAESLFPERARAQAERRVGELEAAGPVGVTMCPICFVNLSKAAGDRFRLSDISEVLVSAYEQGAEVAAEQVAVPS